MYVQRGNLIIIIMIQVIVDYAVLCDDAEEWTSDCVDVV